jgi:hypothetical protein
VRVRASNEYEPQGIKNPFRVLEEALAAMRMSIPGYKWVHMYRPTRRFTEGQDFTDFVEIDYRQPALDWTAVFATEICSPVATNLGIYPKAYRAVHFVMTYAPAEDENGENRDRERDDDGGFSYRRKRTRSRSDAQDDEGDDSVTAEATSEPDEGDEEAEVSIGDVCDVATEEGLKAWLRGRFGDSFRCRVSFRKARAEGNRRAYVQVKCGLGPSDHSKPDRRTAVDAKRRKGNSAKVDGECGNSPIGSAGYFRWA